MVSYPYMNTNMPPLRRTVNDSSVITVQIFDQKKFKRKDQGFLGVINLKVSQSLDLDLGGEGEQLIPAQVPSHAIINSRDLLDYTIRRDAHIGAQKIQ